ncbi:ATP-dependent 6-phosphofructokinase [Desulfovibrio sp. OttesenSCG-928-F20]|nr:ATP-dependent 6-phosphofructokinase [Desulfovibrio sp. OttesenSCG-928-M16]MDL2290893.1 ATP-dependent 6-phosphofructokinase [Desulfovibrio sp. OttesenSCG-928-F20]
MKAERTITIGDFVLDTRIDTLGRASVSSPMPEASFIDVDSIPLFLDNEHIDELNGKEPVAALFEAAGPRRNLYFDPSKTKMAVVTCGGLCPGINDVIRAIVMESYHKYRIPTVLGIRYGLEGFIPAYAHDVVELTPQRVTDIHQFGGTILGSSRGPQEPSEIVDALERMNISALFMIGGDGTMKATQAIVREVSKRKLRMSIIGIPKTIDNDINFISQSFGFETAVFKATEAIQCAHTEALGYKNGIGLVKLMGRESGFIAAHATLAMKEVNFVLIPEIPFALHGEGGLLSELAKRLKSRRHAVIVAAEGAGQHLLEGKDETDASGNAALSDVADVLRREIKDYLTGEGISFSMKYIDPSYIIRSVPANANDKVYCGFLGQNAVHAALAGKTNMVVAKLMERYVHLPLDLVTRKRRHLNIHSEYWQAVLESTGQPELALFNPDNP